MVKQFTLYRPGSNQRDKNISNVSCTVTERDGVADIQMTMLNKPIGSLTMGYDGNKIIIYCRGQKNDNFKGHVKGDVLLLEIEKEE